MQNLTSNKWFWVIIVLTVGLAYYFFIYKKKSFSDINLPKDPLAADMGNYPPENSGANWKWYTSEDAYKKRRARVMANPQMLAYWKWLTPQTDNIAKAAAFDPPLTPAVMAVSSVCWVDDNSNQFGNHPEMDDASSVTPDPDSPIAASNN